MTILDTLTDDELRALQRRITDLLNRRERARFEARALPIDHKADERVEAYMATHAPLGALRPVDEGEG